MENKKFKFINACSSVGINEPIKYLCDKYKTGMSANEIQEYMLKRYNIVVSAKHISDKVKENGLIRSYSERKTNAIKRGRMIYHKKADSEKYKNGNPSQKQRMLALKRDNFKCTLCGNSPNTGATLEIHHINNPSNDIDNLQTLCFQCHRGLHYTEKKEE